MKRQIIPFLILFVLIFSNCDKNNVKNENILLTKTWKRSLIDKNPNSNPSGKILYYAVLDCEKDDTFKFNSDSTLTIEKGLNKCDSTELSSVIVKYSYNNLKNELIIDGIKYTVTEESNGQIKYFLPLPITTGYNYVAYILE
jgi:hypothetical protein